MISIWQQHEYRTEVCGRILRYLRYLDKQRLDSEIGLSMEEKTEMARLYNRLERGAKLSDEEMATVVGIADKRNRYGEYGACFVPSLSTEGCKELLDSMPRAESEYLEKELERLCSGVPDGVHDMEIMVPILTIMKMPITTVDNLTLQQSIVIMNIVSKAMEAKPK